MKKNTRRAKLALLVLGIAAARAAAGAEDEARLFDRMPTIEGASRYEQMAEDAPASVSVVTAADIKRYGYRTLGDIINSVRGFTLSGDRNYSYIGVRGFARAGDYNSRILVLLDGQRLNDNIYEDVGYGQDELIDVAMIEHVEIIRGPGSSIYGSSAFFAVINIVTRRGRDLDGAEAELGAGTEGTGEARLTAGQRVNSGLEYIVSASGFSSRGQTSLYYPEFNTPANGGGYARNADGERAQRVYGKLRMGDLTVAGGVVRRDKQVPTASFGTIFGDNRYHTRDDLYLLQARYDKRFESGTELHTRASFNSYYSWGYYPVDIPPVTINRDAAVGESWNVESFLVTRLGPAHRVVAGLEYQNNTRMNQSNADLVQRLDDQRSGSTTAVYVQDEWRLSSSIIVNAGLRQDRYLNLAPQRSPRAALILKPWNGTVIKLLGGRAFRAPNAYEMFYGDGATSIGNPNLVPERIDTREIVLNQAVGSNLLLTANAYRYAIDRFIRQVTDPVSGLQMFQNGGPLDTSGVELEANWRSAGDVEVRGAFSRQSSRDSLTGLRIAGSPTWTAKFNASLPLNTWNARLSFAARWSSNRPTLAGQTLPAFGTIDAVLLAPVPSVKGLSLSLAIYNALNKQYFDPGAPEHVQDAIEQNGRSLLGRIQYAF